MDVLSISAIVISGLTTIGGIIAGFHLKKSNCMGNSCECYESENKKIERIKSVIDKNYSNNNSPINKEPLKNIIDLNQSKV
jgi:hypothetical protein